MAVKDKKKDDRLSRDRVRCAMRHERVDRVPLFYRDVPEVRQRLLKELKLTTCDELLERLNIDFRWVEPAYVGPALENPDGTRRDIWGLTYRYVRFSDGAGYWELTERPFTEMEDPEALNDWPWPSLDWFDFSVLKEQCERYRDYAIMTAPGYASPNLIQLMEAMCGEQKTWMDVLVEPEFFDALADKIVSFNETFIDRMLEAAGGRIDFMRIGDDYGSQQSLTVGPEPWRARVQPGLKRYAAVAKKYGAYYYHHSCGAVSQLIPDLLDAGVEVLDPLQVSARGMVPTELHAEFGDRLVFSGGVDENKLLSEGSPEKVRSAVRQLIEDMDGLNGGFFIGPTHNFQADCTTENILAMYEAALL